MISIAIIFQMGWHSGLGGARSLITKKEIYPSQYYKWDSNHQN